MCADDPPVLAHAFLQMRALTVARATLRSSQQGFVSPQRDHSAPRNLLGQHDGTANPDPRSPRYQHLIWAASRKTPRWFAGATYLVFRKIRLNLPA